MVEHARDSALDADVVPFITSDSMDVLNTVYPDHDHSFRQVCLTSPDLETGTDRCAAFIEQTMGWDDAPDWIINVQGDMPFGTAPFIKRLIASTDVRGFPHCITPVHVTNVVTEKFERLKRMTHVGMYAWKKEALREFYNARNKVNARRAEKAESLEQLRAVAMKMRIMRLYMPDKLPPLEVNTQADLDRINEIVARCQPGAISTQQARNLALAAGG